ncbi:nitrogen fixation protein FixT/FixU [Zymomonas mobilis subsp. mobilis ZM4 = ATCC 31821]|uniref:Nitrogen fixation protein FixT n=2 Tax=Zymomonas mobilis subsp. mobilis TaxID=120045 RepID=Q5NLG6_ZYMMO|nr:MULTISPECIES: putative nitrogen fixation protein NifT [Zymomonas]AAV90444.1 nitrogen fixation protein FixT [Zymomonas mobilis subsp. mobilis ZM4 = ATCC 31821]ACV75953.1 nitrogen fixation protein FixT [Zymomonas mobilis subsp. mobilis NCIMB 11163]AEH63157.1 nitrogen fixation protein FixT [Zymomonas mobilis subsp. mobilis ATCC 10988]AFN57182.1 nitrogen fixation protein FixT [Zymomonas mobilis subsp. mobilis ATCC 29191]AHB10641.1 putative nitrogen fixation protein FixT [Zymomonas mobilis subsp
MKIMLRQTARGLSVYVPKKDLEEAVIEQEKPDIWGGWIRLKNGWTLELPDMAADTPLPITIEARKRAEEN